MSISDRQMGIGVGEGLGDVDYIVMGEEKGCNGLRIFLKERTFFLLTTLEAGVCHDCYRSVCL